MRSDSTSLASIAIASRGTPNRASSSLSFAGIAGLPSAQVVGQVAQEDPPRTHRRELARRLLEVAIAAISRARGEEGERRRPLPAQVRDQPGYLMHTGCVVPEVEQHPNPARTFEQISPPRIVLRIGLEAHFSPRTISFVWRKAKRES